MADEDNRDDKELDQVSGADIDEDDDESETKGKKGLILIILLVLLLIGGGIGGYFMFMAGDDEAVKEESGAKSSAKEGEGGVTIKGNPVFYEMPEFLVNLSSPGGKPSFLKMKVTLELEGEADIAVIEGYMPRITDNFNTYLRELRASDLSGSAGLYRLREDLLLRINQYTAPTEVKNILFKEVLIQ